MDVLWAKDNNDENVVFCSSWVLASSLTIQVASETSVKNFMASVVSVSVTGSFV